MLSAQTTLSQVVESGSSSPLKPLVGFHYLGPAEQPVMEVTRPDGVRGTGQVRALNYLDLPGKAVERVLAGLYDIYLNEDPIYEAKMRDHPDHDLPRSSDNVERARLLWRTAAFTKQLRELAAISHVWDLSVRSLAFWENEFKDHLNCGRIDDIPAGNPLDVLSFIPPLGITRSCFPCLYLPTFQISCHEHDERTRYSHCMTTDLGAIVVCTDHNAWAICGKCLIWAVEPYVDTQLETNADYETFGTTVSICRGCRYQALDMAIIGRGYVTPLLKQIEEGHHDQRPLVQSYLDRGLGTLRECIDELDRENWIFRDPAFSVCSQQYKEYCREEYLKGVRAKIQKAVQNGRYDLGRADIVFADQHRRMPRFDTIADYQAIQTNVLVADISARIDNGFWLTPQEDQDYRAAFQRDPGHPHDLRFSAVSHTNGYRLISNRLQLQKPPIPPSLFGEMEQIYRRMLSARIAGQLHSVVKAIWRTTDGRSEIALAKARSMSAEELLAWLRDPRSNIRGGWWRDDNIPQMDWPPAQSDVEKKIAAAHTSSSSVAGEKRKREGEDAHAQVEIAGSTSRMPCRDRTRVVDAVCIANSDRAMQISRARDGTTDTSPHFQPKRRATSTSSHASKEARESKDPGDGGEKRSKSQIPSDSVFAARSGRSTSARSGSTPDTPSLVADDTDRSTPLSSEPQSPEVQIPMPKLTALPRSYVEDMVKQVPWPQPQERLTADQIRVFQSGQYYWDAEAPAVPTAYFPKSPVTLDVIMRVWKSEYEEDEECVCGICQRIKAAVNYEYLVEQAQRKEMSAYLESLEQDLMQDLMQDPEDADDCWSDDGGYLTGDEPSDPPSEAEEEDEINRSSDPEPNPFA